MKVENKLTCHIKKRETALIWLMMAFAYTALYSVLENPLYSTISTIGRSHHIFFSFFCFLFGVANLVNLNYMRRVYGFKTKFWLGISYFFNLSFGLVATTLFPNKAAGGEATLFSTIMHWLFGFGGIIANAALSLVFSLFTYNHIKRTQNVKLKRVVVMIWIGASICVLDLLSFVALTAITRDPMKSKNGIFEIIPIMVTYVVLYIVNHTDFISPKAERDAAEKLLAVHDESNFTAVSYGLLACTWIYFTTFSFIRSPIHFTISQIGLEYFGGYAIACVGIVTALVCNLICSFKKHGYKNYFVMIVSLVSAVALLPCIFESTTFEKNIGLVHSVSALLFFFGSLGSMMLYAITMSKKNKKYKPFALAFAGIIAALAVTMILLFVVFDQKYGRTGFAELIPLEAMFAFLYLDNHTNYFDAEVPVKEKIEVKAV